MAKVLEERVEVSALKGESAWMRDIRVEAFDIFLQKPMPAWGGNVANMNLDERNNFSSHESGPVANGGIAHDREWLP